MPLRWQCVFYNVEHERLIRKTSSNVACRIWVKDVVWRKDPTVWAQSYTQIQRLYKLNVITKKSEDTNNELNGPTWTEMYCFQVPRIAFDEQPKKSNNRLLFFWRSEYRNQTLISFAQTRALICRKCIRVMSDLKRLHPNAKVISSFIHFLLLRIIEASYL